MSSLRCLPPWARLVRARVRIRVRVRVRDRGWLTLTLTLTLTPWARLCGMLSPAGLQLREQLGMPRLGSG